MPFGSWADLYALNDAGQLAGFSVTATGTIRAFGGDLERGLVPLAHPEGFASSAAYGLNQAGVRVGKGTRIRTPTSSEDRALVWVREDTVHDLNASIDSSSGWTISQGLSINEAGQILARGTHPSRGLRAVLLTPIVEPPALTLALNQSTFTTGQTVRVALRVQQPGPTFTGDVYFGAILPDGTTAVFISNEGWIQARLDNPRAFRPLAKNAVLSQGLDLSFDPFFAYTFQGGEASGTYSFFAALTPPGAFADGQIDKGDILALAVAPFRFNPSVAQKESAARLKAALVQGLSQR